MAEKLIYRYGDEYKFFNPFLRSGSGESADDKWGQALRNS